MHGGPGEPFVEVRAGKHVFDKEQHEAHHDDNIIMEPLVPHLRFLEAEHKVKHHIDEAPSGMAGQQG